MQLFEQGLEARVAEIDAVRIREQNDTVELKDVVGIGEFFESAVHIRKRKSSEAAETPRPALDQARREFVTSPREPARTRVVSDMDARGRDGRDRDVDSGLIHECEIDLRVPRRWCKTSDRMSVVVRLLKEKIRENVMMGVDYGRHVASPIKCLL